VVSLDSVARSAMTNWTGIIAVEAQTNGAFALDSVGNVYQSGSIVSSTALSSWSEIYVISASDTHLVGIKSDGTVEALGDNTYGQTDVSSWSNIKAIAAADTFTAGLNFDGTVIITGSLTNSTEVATWTDIVDISASDDYLIGLKSDGTVVACGANSSSECDVSDLYDIIDISASINYGAFLRTDGVVVYKGSVESQYNLSVSKLSTNLIYDNYISTTGVYIDLASTTYYIGDVLDLNATISPTDATYQRILYTSSDESVATISSAGTITAKGEGTVTLTAEAYGTSYSDSITITIEPKYALEDMSFEDESRVVLLNNTILLNLIFNPTNATITGTITYSVDSTSATYITVDDNGLVTGIKETMTSAIIYSYATVTATLVQDGVTYTATCQITVQSNITKLAWNSTPTKTEYLYGESLDVSGGSVNITYATGVFTTTTVTESLDSSKVSGYNSNKLGAQTLTITYGEETLTYNINVSNYATGISADSTKTLKTTFNVEDDFSLGSGSFVVTMADGTTISIDEADSNLNISHTDTKLKEMGTHTVIVSYIYDEKEFIYTYAITVSDRVTGINAAAIATEYTYLSEIDSTISVVLTYYSGKTSNVPLSLCTVTGYESNVLGYQTVTVGYTDNTGSTFTNDQTLRVVFSGSVDVINNDTDTSALDKTSPVLYYKDEIPSITVIFTINSTDYIVPLYDETASQDYYYVISGLDSSATYGESYNVNVELYILSTNGNVYSYSKQEPSQQILLQLIHKPVATYITSAETVYYGFTPEAEISFLYDDGTISSPVEISNITIDSYIIGTQTAYFKYSGTIYSFDIEVVDYVVGLQDIADVTIEIGDEFDIDAVVFAQMASGAVEQLAVNQYSRSQCDLTLTGVSQNINIVYEGDMGSYSTSFTLLVLDKVVAVTMVTSFKTEYLYGEEFDYTSSYYVTYVSGNTEIIDYDASLFAFAFGSPDFDNSTSFANTVVDSQTVYVQYAPAAITITAVTVTVSDYIESVTAYLAQTTYSYNEDIAITVYIKMASKSNSEPVYNFTTTYIPTTVGVQDIYVTHEGITVYAGQVEVIDGVRSVSFTGTGRTWFYYGEAFTYIGRTLTVTHESGAVVVYENDDIAAMLQNTYDCTKEGSSKVVFTLCDSVNIAENNVYFSYNEYIKVYAETSATKPSINSSATSAYIYSDSTAFVFTESVTHAELSASIALIDYLTLVAVVDGQDIDLSDTESYVPNGAIAYIVNGDGTIIYTYSIVVVGDLNCDGLINGEDMADIADAYIDDSYQYSDALDLNGDGYFSLTDIVLWAERTSAPANVPVQEVAEIWVTDIKEDGDEE
ncbi:MAG: bacterial Ig-like domain-containing protein, partial [Bacillota bacterium]